MFSGLEFYDVLLLCVKLFLACSWTYFGGVLFVIFEVFILCWMFHDNMEMFWLLQGLLSLFRVGTVTHSEKWGRKYQRVLFFITLFTQSSITDSVFLL